MGSTSTVVLLCRGCCCGTPAKHPHVDHDGQQEALEQAADRLPGAEVRVVDCLDECDRSNVAVIRKPGLPAKDRDTWLGGLLTPKATDALAGWIAHGADGRLPVAVAALRFRHLPPRKGRR